MQAKPSTFIEIGGYHGDDLGEQTHARVHAKPSTFYMQNPLLFIEIGGYYGDDLGGQTHARVHAGTTDPQPGAEPATGSTGSRPSVQRPAALLPSPSPLHAQHLNLA